MPWLMKAEPDSRIVKGKDVKFSVDDFEEIGVSPWDGVRNHEAKKIMKEKMKLGDKVLFYHSNCKTPGVFALAEIAKEGYPDYTAWDPEHPYFDPKSDEGTPTWYMVNVKFVERLPHPPTLALIKVLAALPSSALPEEISYIGEDGLKAIAGMQLVNRGRLSVQPVEEAAYEAICLLGTKGGFEPLLALSSPSSSASASASAKKGKSATSKTKAAPTRTSQTSAASALAANKAAKSLPTNDNDVSAAIARENTIYPGTTTDMKNGKISDGELTPPPLLGDEGEATAKTNKVVTPRKRKNANAKTSASSNDRLDRGAKDETGTKSEVKPEPERHGRVGERRSKRLKA